MNDLNINTPEAFADAVVVQETLAEMLVRLEFIALVPTQILNIGYGIKESTALLQSKYPSANIFELDFKAVMSTSSEESNRALTALADATHAERACFDLIFANFVLPWVEVDALFQQMQLLIKDDGVFICSFLGPDTLKSLSTFAKYFTFQAFDLHIIGDKLASTFADPVLDVSYYTLNYDSQQKMLTELVVAKMCSDEVLHSKMPMKALESTYEVVIAHAFGDPRKLATDQSIAKFSLDHLRKQLRKSS